MGYVARKNISILKSYEGNHAACNAYRSYRVASDLEESLSLQYVIKAEYIGLI